MPFALLLIILAPIIELAVLVKVAMAIGVLPAIGLSILTAALGISLVRSQGLTVLTKVRGELHQGVIDNTAMVEGALLVVAGFFLLFPGFISDTMGALLLIPELRRRAAAWLAKSGRIKVFQQSPFSDAKNNSQGDVFEGEYRKKEDRTDHHLDDK